MTRSKRRKETTNLQSKKSKTFDDVFRTIVQKMPWLMVYVINEVFGTDYNKNVKITQYRNEFHTKSGLIISDMLFGIQDKLYHVECQSNPDSTMELRMLEYDFMIAYEHATKEDNVYTIRLPEAVVMYLRHNSNTPDNHKVRIIFPNGENAEYVCKAIKVQEYSKDEIFQKKLLAFIPFYLMRFEKLFGSADDESSIDNNETAKAEFLAECRDLLQRMESEPEIRNSEALYRDLIWLITKVSDHILEGYPKTKKEAGKIMNGRVLELPSERIARKASKEGIDRVSKLYLHLMNNGRNEDMKKAMEDANYRNQLLKSLNM